MIKKKVLILGASGQIGKHLIRKLTKNNYKAICQTRNAHKSVFLKTSGQLGYIDILELNIFDSKKLEQAISSADICINLIGILFEKGNINTFRNIHTKLPEIISSICEKYKVQFIHFSALGVEKAKDSEYARSKINGENKILENNNEAVIIKPSIVFSVSDSFTTKFLSYLSYLPFFPLYYGLKTKFIKSKNSGVIEVAENYSIKIKILLSDYSNNKTQVNINLIGTSDNLDYYYDDFSNFNSLIKKSEDFSFYENGAEVKIKKNTFNNDTFLDIKYLRDTLFIVNPKVYAFKGIEISMPQKVQNSKQTYIANMDDRGNKIFAGRTKIKNNFKFKTNNLGKFYEDIDSIAPTIKQLNRKNKISFQIKDHETGVKKYDVFVNGKWHLFEYEPKRNEIFCSLNGLEIFEKEINIKVVVEDLVGNRKTLNKRLTL